MLCLGQVRRNRGSAMAMQQQQQQQQQQRRMDLEQEVAELKQQLWSEQAVHDVLHRALRSTVALDIPALIPTKAKELLAEVVLVEEEIARLESQIHRMKANAITSSSEMQMQMPMPIQQQQDQPVPSHSHSNGSGNGNGNGKVAPPPEFKSMFFISQAINGEYLNRHVARSPKEDTNVAAPRRGGVAANANANAMASSRSPKYSNAAVPPRSSVEKERAAARATAPAKTQQPNKLSERIVKCLVCIFIRLLRSSRAAELEKAGSQQVQGVGSFSFRKVDAAAAALNAKDRGRGQQDHYGVFAIQDSIVRDIGPYKNLVSFTSASFDLRAFSTSPLLTKLREMLEALQDVDLRFLTHQQKLAFWLNIYNTCIMHGILQHGLPSNSEKLLALKNKGTINVSGQKFNALVIENFILRQPSSVKEEFWKCDVDVEEQQVRGLYGLNNSEPNIVFALCCGIRSSPALRIYKAERVMMELERAKLEYLQASLVVTSGATAPPRRVMIPGLLHGSMQDLAAKDTQSLLRWVCEQLPTSWPLRKSMVDCLRAQPQPQGLAMAMEEVVDVLPCDYEFQYLLPIL